MSMKRIYSCDICSTKQDDPRNLYGVHFSDMVKFALVWYGSTDGKHICRSCASQLRAALNSQPISEELAAQENKE